MKLQEHYANKTIAHDSIVLLLSETPLASDYEGTQKRWNIDAIVNKAFTENSDGSLDLIVTEDKFWDLTDDHDLAVTWN